MPILELYRDKICTYNDDIQGTAAIALAGIFAALRITKQKLTDQRFLFLGGGSAATGIAELISEAMALEGLDFKAARARNALFDINGLVVRTRNDLADFQRPFALDHAPIPKFVDAVKELRPTAIIGVSTVPKLFNQAVIETMADINKRPIIFPYSNPTSRSECTAEEAYRWSQGRAIFASGSPFPPVEIEGQSFTPGQGNNVYIFPAMGMAIFATEAKRVTEEMFIVAAKAVAEQVTEKNLADGLIYPPQSKILEASLHVAARIAEFIFDHDLAGVPRPADISAHIRSRAYRPVYPAPTPNNYSGASSIGSRPFTSKPNMSKLFCICGGSGAVTSSVPPRGCGSTRRRASRCSLCSTPSGICRIGSMPARRLGIARIFRIADDRMADGFGMRAQLMRAAGDRLHRQPRQPRRDLVDHGVIGHRMLRVLIAMFGDAHLLARDLARSAFGPRVAHAFALGEKQRDAPLRRLRHALDQRPIDFLRLPRAENLAELGRDRGASWRRAARPTYRGRGDAPAPAARPFRPRARPACHRYGAWCRSRPAPQGHRAC